MVGARTEPRFAGTAVSAARIQHFASMVRDPNPSYWDAEFAAATVGRPGRTARAADGLADPAAVGADGEPPTASIAVRVPLPGTTIINASNDAEFLSPILEGDRLSVVEEVVSVSPEKTTRLGAGHFVETLETLLPRRRHLGRHQPKHVVPLHACERRHEVGRDRRACRSSRGVDEISYERVVMNAGTTWDYFPGTTTRTTPKATAIQRFSSTPCTSPASSTGSRPTWAGPHSRVVRRKVTLLGSIYAGDSMVGRGRVIDKRCDSAGDAAAIPGGSRGRGLQPARRIVLPRRGHAGTCPRRPSCRSKRGGSPLAEGGDAFACIVGVEGGDLVGPLEFELGEQCVVE